MHETDRTPEERELEDAAFAYREWVDLYPDAHHLPPVANMIRAVDALRASRQPKPKPKPRYEARGRDVIEHLKHAPITIARAWERSEAERIAAALNRAEGES